MVHFVICSEKSPIFPRNRPLFLKAGILKSIITWSAKGKQTAQAKEVYTTEALLGVLAIRDNWQNNFGDKG